MQLTLTRPSLEFRVVRLLFFKVSRLRILNPSEFLFVSWVLFVVIKDGSVCAYDNETNSTS